MLNRIAVTIVSGAKPLRYSKPFCTTSASGEKIPASASPFSMTSANTAQPKTRPMAMPVSMDCLARFGLFAPTFCATKDAMDCIRALGISMAKFTILLATP